MIIFSTKFSMTLKTNIATPKKQSMINPLDELPLKECRQQDEVWCRSWEKAHIYKSTRLLMMLARLQVSVKIYREMGMFTRVDNTHQRLPVTAIGPRSVRHITARLIAANMRF